MTCSKVWLKRISTALKIRLGAACLLVSCCNLKEEDSRGSAQNTEAETAQVSNQLESPPKPKEKPCEDRIDGMNAVFSETTRADIEDYESILPQLALRTRLRPVVYLAKPKKTRDEKAQGILDALSRGGKSALKSIRSIKERYKDDKAFLRELFLSEGYFFNDNPDIAPYLVREISLMDLFDQPVIHRLSGAGVETLHRREFDYFDGMGNRAALHLNDRVQENETALLPPLHIDIGEVRRLTHALQVKALSIRNSSAAAALVFPDGEERVALLRVDGGRTLVECIGGPVDTLDETMEKAKSFWTRNERIIEAAKQLVSERAIFDEPEDEPEDVQEDGDLRVEWLKAYRRKKKSFMFREVMYPVFDRLGNPVPPQVCLDFIFDVWERAFGTWYNPRGKNPGRSNGTIDFSLLENMTRRHIPSLLHAIATADTPFERCDIPRRHWAPYERRGRFLKALLKHANVIREGDALVIHGLRDEDMEEHFHSVVVLETDPVTGIPTMVADNQGRPRIWSLANAMQTAPKRSIKYRIRVDFDRMEALTKQLREQSTSSSSSSGAACGSR